MEQVERLERLIAEQQQYFKQQAAAEFARQNMSVAKTKRGYTARVYYRGYNHVITSPREEWARRNLINFVVQYV